MSVSHISQRLYTISPHAPFIPHLVKAILEGPLLGDWQKNNPFWLADVTIILPTERARLALSSEFASALGGGALLPDIQTLGGEEGEAHYFEDPNLKIDLPKAISHLERQFLLCQLVEKWAQQNGQNSPLDVNILRSNPARILSLAKSLGDLIDELNIEGVKASALRAVPDVELDPTRKNDLAANFMQNLKFLEIVLTGWPEILNALKLVDASALNILRVNRQIDNLATKFGERPVIAAGSTGSVPSTAKLLKAITALPRGCLVLPGLDTRMAKETFFDLLEPSNAPHGHPQYGVSQLLRRLNQSPWTVEELAPSASNRRVEIVADALALAKDTSNWNHQRTQYTNDQINDAVGEISIIAGNNERQQALAIALAARETLSKGKSVGIITPDRNFARRIAVELKRFGIEVDDSAGTPLFHSPTGRLVRQILSVVLSGFSAVDLMALLRNPHVQLNGPLTYDNEDLYLLEYGLLRGQRPANGLAGLRQTLEKNLNGNLDHPALKLNKKTGLRVEKLLDELEAGYSELSDLFDASAFSAATLANALMQVLLCMTSKTDLDKADLPGFTQFTNWVDELARTTQLGPQLTSADAMAVLQALMGNISVRTASKNHSNIAIWGRLEARMQNADLLILATLNEEVWPEIADPGPWLSRGMRLNAGLEPPERHQGLAAHDFEMAMGNQNMLLSYSRRIGSTPALPSRLLARFCSFVGELATQQMEARGSRWLTGATMMDKVKSTEPAIRPLPCPPAKIRPRSISITEVETLIRNPFALYAKYVLGLKPLDPLGEDVSYRERGTLVHQVFADFIEAKHDPMDENAHDNLMGIARNVFANLENLPERRDLWLKRLENSANGFLAFERARNGEIKTRFAEQNMRWTFEIEGQEFTLHGKADRIDLRHDGLLEIIDYKTGEPPKPPQMKNYMAPQLLVEAAIAKAQGFGDLKPAATHSLEYIKIGADPVGFSPREFCIPTGIDVMGATDTLMRLTQGRIKEFLLSDHLPMTARLMPNSGQNYAGPYDHLARVDEWSEIEGEESE